MRIFHDSELQHGTYHSAPRILNSYLLTTNGKFTIHPRSTTTTPAPGQRVDILIVFSNTFHPFHTSYAIFLEARAESYNWDTIIDRLKADTARNAIPRCYAIAVVGKKCRIFKQKVKQGALSWTRMVYDPVKRRVSDQEDRWPPVDFDFTVQRDQAAIRAIIHFIKNDYHPPL